MLEALNLLKSLRLLALNNGEVLVKEARCKKVLIITA